MSIRVSELELPFLRKTIEVERYGEEYVVNIFNILGEKRVELVNFIQEKTTEGKDNDVIVSELSTRLLEECTDLELDDDIINVFNSPSIEFITIQSEVSEIIHELQCEAMMSYIAKLNQTEILLYADLAIKKSNRINKIIEDIKEIERSVVVDTENNENDIQ